jgi:hypothetical protein
MTSAPAVPAAMIRPQSGPPSPGRLQDELEPGFAINQSNFADIGQLLRPPHGARMARLPKMKIRR